MHMNENGNAVDVLRVDAPPPVPEGLKMSNDILLWPDGISRDLMSFGKIRIQSYLKKPEVIISAKKVASIVSYCTLRIFYDDRSAAFDSRSSFQERSFKVNLRNYMKTMRFFQGIMRWFEDDSFANLFFLDKHTGELRMDLEQRNIKLHLGGNTKYDQCAMEAVPAVYKKDNEIHEGAMIAINRSNYSEVLRDIDIESICGLLANFSFQAETLLMIQLYQQKGLWVDASSRYGGYSGVVVNWSK